MAKVYAPARVDSSSSNSASSPQFTPTSSQDRPMIPGLRGVSSRDGESCTLTVPQPSAFDMHQPHGRSPFTTNNLYSPYYQPSQFSHYHQPPHAEHSSHYNMAPAYSKNFFPPPRPTAPPAFDSRPRPYSGGYVPYGALLEDVLYQSGPFHNEALSTVRPVSLTERIQAERALVRQKLVDQLRELDLYDDRMGRTQSAFTRSQVHREANQDPASESVPVRAGACQHFPPYSGDADKSREDHVNDWNTSTADGAWNTTFEEESRNNRVNAPAQEASDRNGTRDDGLAPCRVESSYRSDVYPSASNPKQENKKIDVWDSASPASEAPSITPNDNWEPGPAWEAQSSVDETDVINKALKFGAGKFNDPHLIKVSVPTADFRSDVYLFVQKTTFEKLLSHYSLDDVRDIIVDTEVVSLPYGTEKDIEALKEILSLLELDGIAKQEAICRTIATDLLADMYGIAEIYELDHIPELLLNAIFSHWSIEVLINAAKKLYSTGSLDARFRDMFKARVRQAIQPNDLGLWGACLSASWDDAMANVTKARDALSSIQISSMKNDIYEVLLEKACSDARVLLEDEKYDNAQGPQDISNDKDDLVQESGEVWYEDTVDNHDNTADPVCEVWEGFDDTPPRPPTPKEKPQAWITGGSDLTW